MGVIDVLAAIGRLVPSAPRPVRRLPIGRRLVFTLLTAVVFVAMASTPLYGIETAGRLQLSPIVSVVLAMRWGTLAQLGIGPIVTAGLILQILVGAKFIKLDLTNPEDRKKFTLASKGLAVVFAIVEAAGFVVSNLYWRTITPSIAIKLIVFLQLVWGAILVIMLDEAMQKGWGLGSGVSLFILLGVAQRIFVNLLNPLPVELYGVKEIVGIIPYTIASVIDGTFRFDYAFLWRGIHMFPTYLGLITTLVLIAILSYLQSARIYVPITSPRLRGIRTRIPLQLLYVTNIPVLLTAILISDINLFLSIAANANPSFAPIANRIRDFLAYPTIFRIMYRPLESAIYIAIFFALCIAFGIAWVEIAGLNPEAQAENLIRSGFEIPGMRRNPRVLASYLARYIYPLTVLSSIIVALIAIVGDIFLCYGTGTGILLAVGIVYNYYQMLVYEKTLEMYPALKRLIGE